MEDLHSIVEKHLLLKDRLKTMVDAHKAKVEKIKAVIDSTEAYLLQTFDASGVESVRTPAGTAYISEKSTAAVGDWQALLSMIVEGELWHMLQKRVSTDAVREYIESTGSVPPGVDWRRERTVNVRRSA